MRTPRLRGRIRIFGDKGFITFKSEPGVVSRYKYEYEIPKHEAEEMVSRFNIEPMITKTPPMSLLPGWRGEVDVFECANAGLVVAELEVRRDEGQAFEKSAVQRRNAELRVHGVHLAGA